MYFPLQNACSNYTVVIASRKEPATYGVRAQNLITPGTQNVGTIYAVSASTGHTEWKVEQRAALLSLVTTGGGLVFGGDVAGRFRAYDQRTGAVLWQTPLGSQVTGFPITYAVGDRQYVAVSVGQAVNTAAYLTLTPEIRPSSNNTLFVFALPAGWETASSRGTPPPPVAALASPPIPTTSATATQCRRTSPASAASTAASPAALPHFPPARVTEGRRVFTDQQCAACHGENLRGSASAPALADPGFRIAWQGRPLTELFDCLKTTMPPGRGGTLPDADYLRLLGVILEANGWNGATAQGSALPTRATLNGRTLPRADSTNTN
jgi:alcohol dehydrogenase (cytochrome c)